MNHLTDFSDPNYPGRIGFCVKCGHRTNFRLCFACFLRFLASGLRDIEKWLNEAQPEGIVPTPTGFEFDLPALPPLAPLPALTTEAAEVLTAPELPKAPALDAETRRQVEAIIEGNLPPFPLDPHCEACCWIMNENNSGKAVAPIPLASLALLSSTGSQVVVLCQEHRKRMATWWREVDAIERLRRTGYTSEEIARIRDADYNDQGQGQTGGAA